MELSNAASVYITMKSSTDAAFTDATINKMKRATPLFVFSRNSYLKKFMNS